ncbi:MAG: protoporphyrinogen oxidase, partial [Nevskiales bacterium]
RPENLAPKEQRDKEIVDKIRGDVEKLGGKVDEVLALRRWLYFPHVSAAAMRDGFYDRLEGLQGTNNTFYSWSLMNFETVHHVTKYSKHLVAKHFSGPTQ